MPSTSSRSSTVTGRKYPQLGHCIRYTPSNIVRFSILNCKLEVPDSAV